MATIALYFGSFNPIHQGHIKVATSVLDNTKKPVDEVWFLPSPQNPFKNPEGLADYADRMQMASFMVRNNKKFYLSGVEGTMPAPNYTYKTMEHFRKRYSKNIFSIIIGADNYKTLSSWKNYDELIAYHNFFVVARDGDDFSHMENNKFTFLPAVDTLSSTQIRERIKNGESIAEYTSEEVSDYIQKNSLYQK